MKLPNLISAIAINLFSNFSFGVVYNTIGSGNWNDVAVWVPAVPPNPLAAGDVVNVTNNMNLNMNITINGNLTIAAGGILSGSKNITINALGQMLNNGSATIDMLTNHGTITNNNTLTTNNDLVNDRVFINNAAGNISILNSKDLDNRNGTFTNNGTISIDHDLKNDNGNVTNNGTMNVSHNFDNKNGNAINNSSMHIAHDLVNNPGSFTNNSSLTVDNDIKNKDGMLDGTNGSYIVGNHIDNNDGTITGTVNVCKPDGITNPIINGGAVGAGVVICGAVMPVELISLTAENKENTVEIRWATASETNSDYFSVEKSKYGINFQSVGKVKAAGNSTHTLHYTLKDNSPYTGVTYYSLKQISKKDNAGFYKTVSVNCMTANESMKIYPNPIPAEETLTVEFPKTGSDKMQITIGDFTGKIIYSRIFEGTAPIVSVDLQSKPAPGIYWITARSSNSVSCQKLFIPE